MRSLRWHISQKPNNKMNFIANGINGDGFDTSGYMPVLSGAEGMSNLEGPTPASEQFDYDPLGQLISVHG